MHRLRLPTFERDGGGGGGARVELAHADIKRPPARSKVTFGGVTVNVIKPSAAQIKYNIDVSTKALARAKKRLMRGGVRLYAKKDVPIYFADPEQPGAYFRKLNGKIDRGVLEDGKFKVIK